MTTPTLSKQATIAQEVRAALVGGPPLSTTDLVPRCETADDAVVLSRVIYDLRQSGMIAEDPTPGGVGRNGKPAKRWRWIGPEQAPVPPVTAYKNKAAKPEAAPKPTPADVPHIPMEEVAEMMPKPSPIMHDSNDPTELALSDLVDQADEALLALADSLLAGNPVWARLRTLANDAFGALCDYRLMRSLEDSHD